MAVSEQRRASVMGAEAALGWLRLALVMLIGVALLVADPDVRPKALTVGVIAVGVLYAVTDSTLGLYRRYRRRLLRKAYVVIDLALITVLVYLTGDATSPLYLLYALPLVVVVIQNGARDGLLYMLAVTMLSGAVATWSDSGASPAWWVTQNCALWALYLLVGIFTYTEDERREKARRRDELDAMHRAASAPMHTGDLPTVIEKMLNGALGATRSCWAGIYLYSEEDDCFFACYSLSGEGREATVQHATPQVASSDVLYRVLYTRVPEAIADLQAEPRLRSSVLNEWGVRSAIVTPLIAPGARRIGIMCLGREGCRKVTQHEMRFAGTLTLQAASSINSAYLFEEAASIEAAKEADKLRTQLLGTVSHELRTPIAAIKGFASSLRDVDELNVPKEMENDWIAEIEDNAERLNTLVNDLLDLSRLESGALRMSLEWQDINDVIEDLRPNLQLLAGDRNLEMHTGASLPLIKCDAERIGQVLRNLVENAAKFSPAGSYIVIGAERKDTGIRVGVRDEGKGIEPEFQDKVFERFYQVEGASYSPQKGTGLGLAICRNIVEAHGGRIWVESVPGQGSIFYFQLPSPSGPVLPGLRLVEGVSPVRGHNPELVLGR